MTETRIPMSLEELAGGDRPTTKAEFQEVFGIPPHTIAKWARAGKIVKFNLGTKQAYYSLKSFLQLLESSRHGEE